MSKNPYLNVDKEILGDIYSSSEPMDNLIKMCDEFGSRFPGTLGDKLAVDFMISKFKEYGFENVLAEAYTVPGWVRGSSSLEITSPINRAFDCIALPHSLEGEVEAKLVYLGDGPIDVYEKRKDEIKGNIVMVTSRTPRGMNRPLHRTEKVNRSILADAEGFIFMNHYPAYGPPTGGIATVIPAVGVSYEEGNFIIRALKRFKDVTVKISSKCENKDMESWNVIADLPGTTNSEEYVLVGAHYEGHDIAVGAVDSGSGACVVLEIARVFSKIRKNLKRRIRFLCFSAEEIGLYGSTNYARMHKEELKNLRFMLNLDAAGSEGVKGFAIHGWPDLEQFFKQVAQETNAIMPIYQRVSPYSDHWPFFIEGVPTASMSDPDARQRRGGRGYGHTRYDTVDKVNIKYMWEAAANGSRLLFRVANSDEWPVEHRSREEIDDIVEKQGYNETMALILKMVEYASTKDKYNLKGLKPPDQLLIFKKRIKSFYISN
jgi:Iap family predicted aminopeptidase